MTLAQVRGFPTARGPLDLDVREGDVLLLRGPNGSGKTSLLRALAGLPAPRAPVAAHARAPAYAPQDARDALLGLTVAGEFRLRRASLPPTLAPLASRESATLSAGESRRVALGALVGDVLLLDEPVEGLDAAGRAALVARVEAHRARGAVVAADHGDLLRGLATRVVELGEAAPAPLPAIPRAPGAPVVLAAESRARGVTLPALALGPGFHVLVGPNGCGKTTLLLRLAGLLDAEGVRLAGAPPEPGRNVRLALAHAADALTRERVADECGAHPLVPDALRERHPLSLSGGEAQRVALAKALGVTAPLYLLDEPEAHLDAEGRALLVAAIAARVAEGACVLAATHDTALRALAHSVVSMEAPA